VFNSSHIHGKIEKVFIISKGTALKLVNDSVTYVFYPMTSPLNDNQIFDGFATKGDSVIKSAHSDTLKLLKGDKAYLYTFEKLDD
jgi:hypothetical protein